MESYVCLYGDERMLMYGNYCTFFHTYMFMADRQPVCCMSRMEMSNNYKLQIRLSDLFFCTFPVSHSRFFKKINYKII